VDPIAWPRFGLWYDFRNPAPWQRPWARLYAEIGEQAAWAERELGMGSAWLTEHHFVDDGYSPSPLVHAAALAVRTSTMRIATGIVILPLHHPLRIAEDALTLHGLSGGRFVLGVGMGYRAGEFDAYGVPMGDRKGRMEESLAVLRAALDGRDVDHRGRHFDIGRVPVTPRPIGGGGPPLYVGQFAPSAIRRAATLADGMHLPVPELWALYADECARLGRPARIATGFHWIIADDPEAELARSAPHVMHQVNEYGALGAYCPAEDWVPITDAADLLARSPYELLDGEAAAQRIAEHVGTGLLEDVHWWTIFPGEPIERSNARLEYAAKVVIPRAKELVAAKV
jgi:alkanesulfonate monooxygenase SsuD/methylene tetrahydromethanopterin reductase-like flavin-dependent oxidoreductase (luciferase family)